MEKKTLTHFKVFPQVNGNVTIQPENIDGYITGPLLVDAFTALNSVAPRPQLSAMIIKYKGRVMRFTAVSLNTKNEVVISLTDV